MNLDLIQQALRDRKLGGWLFCDFHNRDHLAYRILGLDSSKMTTRRWFYFIPAKGEPRRLVHSVEKFKLEALPGSKTVYLPWEQLHASLKKMLGPKKTIAMQYSPLTKRCVTWCGGGKPPSGTSSGRGIGFRSSCSGTDAGLQRR